MTFSVIQIVTVLILGGSSFISGWLLRRIQAKAREAALQKTLLEAQGIVPQLQTNVRNRDQRIGSLMGELIEWKDKIPALEALVKRRDIEVLAKDRELKVVRIELGGLKQAVAAAPSAEAIDALRETLRTSQARCAGLTANLAEAQQRAAGAAGGPVAPPTDEPAGDVPVVAEAGIDWMAKVGGLEADVQERDRNINDLQARLDAQILRRDTLEAATREHNAEIERLRAEASKWQTRVPKLVATIKARDGVIADHDAALADQGRLLSERDGMLAERDIVIRQRDGALAERSAQLVDQERVLLELGAELEQRRVDEAAAFGTAQQQIAALTAQIDTTSARVEALTTLLGDRDAAIALFETRIVTQEREFEATLAQHMSKLTTALRIGREELDSHRVVVGELEADRDARLDRVAMLEQDLETLRTQHAEMTAAAQARADRDGGLLAEFASVRDQLSERLASAGAQLGIGDRQRSVLEAERAALAGRATALQQQVTEAQQNAITLQQSLYTLEESAAETQIRLIESEAQRVSEHAAAEQRMAALLQQQGSAEHEVVMVRQSLTALQARADRADTQRLDVLAQRTSLEDRIGGLLSEQGDIKETAAAMQRSLNAARDEQMNVAMELSRRDAEVAALRNELTSGNTRVAPLEDMLRERDAVLAARAHQIEVLTSQIETQDVTLHQRAARISELETQVIAQPSVDAEEADRRADELEQTVVAQIERNRVLSRLLEERDREVAVTSKQRDLNEKSLLVLKQQLDGARESEERLAGLVRELKATRRDPEPDVGEPVPAAVQPQGLFQSPPDQVDDLQQIRGIGAGFERGLNKLGIYRFSQLTGLSGAAVVWIENHLPTFRGRIERDDWPGQAAALMAETEPGEWSLRAPPEVAASSASNGSASAGPIN